jgi:hypothetical protein
MFDAYATDRGRAGRVTVPSIALAAKPASPGNSQGRHGNAAPNVTYIFRGMLTEYAAANGSTDGSVSILVKSSNHHGASLKGQTLKFDVSSSTRVVVRGGGTLTVTDRGIVKVRGPKNVGPTEDLATVLQALTARQVIDQGPAS